VYSYTNQSSVLGADLSSVPAIYAEQGTSYYFKVFKFDMTAHRSNAYYKAIILSGNYADCDSSQFLDKGYVSDRSYVYNGSNNIYVYFESDTYNMLSCGSSYRDIILDAMSQWNKVGEWQWVEVDSEGTADTIVSTYHEDSGTIAYYSSIFHTSNKEVFRGEMHMNTKYSGYPYDAVLHICVHELGHGLGLGHINYDGETNVMYYAASSSSTFTQFG